MSQYIQSGPENIRQLMTSSDTGTGTMSGFARNNNDQRRTIFAPINKAFDQIQAVADLNNAELLEQVIP